YSPIGNHVGLPIGYQPPAGSRAWHLSIAMGWHIRIMFRRTALLRQPIFGRAGFQRDSRARADVLNDLSRRERTEAGGNAVILSPRQAHKETRRQQVTGPGHNDHLFARLRRHGPHGGPESAPRASFGRP